MSTDQSALVERITSEVINRLKAESAGGEGKPGFPLTSGATPGTTPGAKPGVMPPATSFTVCTGDTCIQCNLCVTRNPSGVKSILDGGASRVSSTIGVVNVPADVAPYIDHTLLKPEATRAEIEQLCDEAAKYGFYSVCVNPYWTPLCAKLLRGKTVKVCNVIGFPLGATDSRTKGFEARNAIEQGAAEIDMVINIGALKGRDLKAVEEDIRSVARSSRSTTVLKVIIETCLLTDEEKVLACEISKKAGAHFVKSSTGFSKGGATAKDIALMRRVVGPGMGVKASGGVRTYEDAKLMIESGATRIGASASVKISTAFK
jgi:deoxyribose-phosphate aldolase